VVMPPEEVPLIKRVAGLAGDRICACDATIFVNGRALATRREADRIGRPLPRWNGCRTLEADTVFLLMPDAPDSFDGRYFGAIPLTSIIERLAPLWTE
jgi:type IV secretory pathway protease TraF